MARDNGESGETKAAARVHAPAAIDLLRGILGESAAGDLPRLLADPRFQELVEIVDLAIQVHGEEARNWFVRPEPELGFVHPATLMRDPANGRLLVKQSLMNHLRGVYALGRDGRVLPKALPVLSPAPELEGPREPRARLPKPPKKPRAR